MTKKKYRKRLFTFFFWDGDLHRVMHINRSADIVRAWNYPRAKLITYIYSDVKRLGERAFTTGQVAKMINRSVRSIQIALAAEMIEPPQKTYSLDGNHMNEETRRYGKYMWCEKDIMRIHAYYASLHIGRPRKDGAITNQSLPTALELRAMIRQETILYVKQGDKFVPTWKAE